MQASFMIITYDRQNIFIVQATVYYYIFDLGIVMLNVTPDTQHNFIQHEGIIYDPQQA
jgi:hypothetical protein